MNLIALSGAVAEIANQHGLPFLLVKAMVEVESNFNIYAYRVEPRYRYLVNVETGEPFRELTIIEIESEYAPQDFPYYKRVSSRHTEWWGQQASWGPLQVMGAVAREYGFTGAFPELCSIEGLRYGCMHLANYKRRFLEKHGWEGVAAAYNAGSVRILTDGTFENQTYVDKVRRFGGFSFEETKEVS